MASTTELGMILSANHFISTVLFNLAFWIVTLCIGTACFGYIVVEFTVNKKVRYIPSRLMVARALFNYLALLIVLGTQRNLDVILDRKLCEFQGAALLFSLYISTFYYALIWFELYLILKNPFRKPSSGNAFIHIVIFLICLFIVTTLALFDGFKFRDGFEVCFLKKREEYFNILNLFLVYIPVFGICAGGLIATIWVIKKLKSTIIDETFELRWLLIKQQTVIIVCFTLNYLLQGTNWSVLFFFNDEHTPKYNPYLLCAFCLIAVIFDAITWIIRKYIKVLSSNTGIERKVQSQNINNISDALRKEVITCIIDGLAQCISQNMTIIENKNEQKANSKNEKETQQLIEKRSTNSDYYHSMDNEAKEEDVSLKYPRKMTGKCEKGIMEKYNIDPIDKCGDRLDVVFTDFGSAVFKYLRNRVYGVSDGEYYKSILPSTDIAKISLDLVAKFSEGKSGAFFFFSKDLKYLIKTLTKEEAKLLLDTLPKYVNFMKTNHKTYLSKYFGLHSIRLYGERIFFMVTKNIFSALDQSPDETYDIKGSWVDRSTSHIISDRKLMKDHDLHNKLLLDSNTSQTIYRQLEKDAAFLSSVKIMDYSLLLGVCYTKIKQHKKTKTSSSNSEDEENKQDEKKNYEILDAEIVVGPGKYIIGIIDMLQFWDIRKKTERYLKAYFLCKDKNGISCVPPEKYEQRFLDKMMEIGIGHKFRSERNVMLSITD